MEGAAVQQEGHRVNIDHIALNAVSLQEEIEFFVGFLGLRLLQEWESPRQAYVGAQGGPVRVPRVGSFIVHGAKCVHSWGRSCTLLASRKTGPSDCP